MWVLAPTGEFLSFASPKERNQRKGDPDAACFLRGKTGLKWKNIAQAKLINIMNKF
jgi:hypothetical protein